MMKSSSDAEDENELKSALLVLIGILRNRTGAERIHIERAWADDEVTRRRRGSVQCFDRAETRPYHKSRTGGYHHASFRDRSGGGRGSCRSARRAGRGSGQE